MKISIILFEDFELLDVFGPVELFGFVDEWNVEYLGSQRGLVRSSQGAQIQVDKAYTELESTDMILIPGGRGTRTLVQDKEFLAWLTLIEPRTHWITSVCTGSAVLAAAGLLEKHRATTNKRAYKWATGFGTNVSWDPRARWVQSGNRWSSSGISAGIDMAAAIIRFFKGEATAKDVCERAELTVCTDPSDDPFYVDNVPLI